MCLGDVGPAGHKTSNLHVIASESRSVCVRMLWSAISALFLAYYHCPTRPDGRDMDPGRFGTFTRTRKCEKKVTFEKEEAGLLGGLSSEQFYLWWENVRT